MSTCETCKWFKKGETTGILTRAIVAGRGRYYPSTSDILIASSIDKDGACTLMPEPVQKRKSDSCGQFAEKAA